MPDVISRGRVDGGGAGPGGEVGAVGEPGDVADLDQQPRGPRGADAGQVQQAGARGPDEFGEFLVGGLLALVGPLEVADQFGSDPAANLARGVPRPHLAQDLLGLRRGQELLRSAWDQLEEQVMQLSDHPGVLLTQRPATVCQLSLIYTSDA